MLSKNQIIKKKLIIRINPVIKTLIMSSIKNDTDGNVEME